MWWNIDLESSTKSVPKSINTFGQHLSNYCTLSVIYHQNSIDIYPIKSNSEGPYAPQKRVAQWRLFFVVRIPHIFLVRYANALIIMSLAALRARGPAQAHSLFYFATRKRSLRELVSPSGFAPNLDASVNAHISEYWEYVHCTKEWLLFVLYFFCVSLLIKLRATDVSIPYLCVIWYGIYSNH